MTMNRSSKRSRCEMRDGPTTGKRRCVVATELAGREVDELPDDLILSILCKISSTASTPADISNILMTCKRMNELGQHPHVLHKATVKALAVGAKNWSDSAHRFLQRCADAGNLEACYTLGMIEFYCLEKRSIGATLMARAAMSSHAAALYSLAIIQFNGSGGSKNDKNPRAGVALCARAASFGHVDALRELGHCFQDGYGVHRDINKGRRFLIQANARELAAVVSSTTVARLLAWSKAVGMGCPLLSDYGYTVPPPVLHPANRFLVEWFKMKRVEGVRVCSHGDCGRPETRENEFRRCSACGAVSYCSRACQALHWKLAHKVECSTLEHLYHDVAAAAVLEAAHTIV